MGFNLNVVSWNIGTIQDWKIIAARSEILKTNGKKLEPGMDLSLITNTAERIRSTVQKQHDEIVSQKLHALIDQFQPTIICLQEYFDTPEHRYKTVRSILSANGFTLLGTKDCAIAYKTDKFLPASSLNPTFETTKTPIFDQGFDCFPDMYIDLKDVATGCIVRVVSGHIKGFDSIQQKCTPKTEKTVLAETHLGRINQFLKSLRQPEKQGAAHGDASLELSLQAVETVLTSDQKNPDMIVYGLDANATPKSIPNKIERLHPKRFRLFEIRNYQRDATDQSPTIIDGNDFQKRAYDAVLVKSDALRLHITNHRLLGINSPELLDDPDQLASDHLPVLAQINYVSPPPQRTRKCWQIFCCS